MPHAAATKNYNYSIKKASPTARVLSARGVDQRYRIGRWMGAAQMCKFGSTWRYLALWRGIPQSQSKYPIIHCSRAVQMGCVHERDGCDAMASK